MSRPAMTPPKFLSLLGFPLAGLLSAIITVGSSPKLSGSLDFLSGPIYGTSIALCLWIFANLRSLWKTLILIGLFTLAYFASFFAAALSHDYIFNPWTTAPDFLPELFVGGLVGALILTLATYLTLWDSKQKPWLTTLKIIACALCGGGLAVLASTMGPLVGEFRRRYFPSNLHGADRDVSLTIVWQTGMAFMLALAVWTWNDDSKSAQPETVHNC